MVHSLVDYQNLWRGGYQALAAMSFVLSLLSAGSVVGGEPPTSLPRRVGNPGVFQLAAFEAEYQEKTRKIIALDAVERYEKARDILSSMIGEEVYENGRRGIVAALISNRGLVSSPTAFAKIVSSALVRHLVYSGDRAGLVEVLAFDCPKLVEIHTTIEFELAVNSDHLLRSVGALCDAFDLCTDDSNRTMIIAALRRGFEPMGIVQKDDKDFVRECRKWLSALDSTWEVNPFYEEGLEGEKTPLFIKRRSDEK